MTEREAQELSQDYARFFRVATEKNVKQVEEAIDDTLTRLDEFSGVMNMVSPEISDTISHEIVAKKSQLLALFVQIQSLEIAVARVKKTVYEFEGAVNKAETELNASAESRIKKFFKNPIFKKNQIGGESSMDRPPPTFSCPETFVTSDLFPKSKN